MPATRKGFCLPPGRGKALVTFLRGWHPSFWQRLWGRLPFSSLRREGVQWSELASRLGAVPRPSFLRPLKDCTGLLAFHEHDLWFVYRVLGGRARLLAQFPEDLDVWLAAQAPGLSRGLHKASASGGAKWPLKAQEAREISRVAWWTAFGVRKLQGRFIGLRELGGAGRENT